MIDISIMIEGQDGLNWARWQKIARAVEDLGFAGLYRSDHFTNAGPPDKDSLELWVSLTWLASHTRRIHFGQLVSPVSFRDPVFLARMALQVDDLSGGRLHLGMGAGWQEREHNKFGYELLSLPQRFRRFAEGLEVVTRLLHNDHPVDFDGAFYHLREAVLLPRPQRPYGPPIVIGGKGEQRTLPLAAHYADEWNAPDLPPERYAELNRKLDVLLEGVGRSPADVKRTLMTSLIFAADERALQEKIGRHDPDALRQRGVIYGPAGQVEEQLARLEEAGVQEVMLRWSDLDDLDGLEAFARSVLHAAE